MTLEPIRRLAPPIGRGLATIAIICGASLVAARFTHQNPEAGFRWAGMVLQIVGISLVARDLNATTKNLTGVSVWEALLAELRLTAGGIISATGTMVGTANLDGRSGVTYDENIMTLDERVRHMQVRLEQQENRMADLKQVVAAIDVRMESQRKELEGAITRVQNQLNSSAAGGLLIKFAGFGYVIAGTVLGSISPELPAIFGSS